MPSILISVMHDLDDAPDQLLVLVTNEHTSTLQQDDFMQDGELPCISFHALTRKFIPATVKIARVINERYVIVLIDGASMNNFIQSHLAKHLGLIVQPSSHL